MLTTCMVSSDLLTKVTSAIGAPSIAVAGQADICAVFTRHIVLRQAPTGTCAEVTRLIG